MHAIKIIEYKPEYAAGLADMWNRSSEGWGGETTVNTAESVREEMDSSDNLLNWLALAGDEVVGYCGFSEYKEDEGASYIPLLNVRPDYYGKKIGKLLVLKAVAAACSRPWPRLDLYTWPGNTKAVPLYKKCGFFWEDRDDSTHLMNFMPYVRQTEAVADFFDSCDWYADSVRPIVVEPDGRKENGFDIYEYSWRCSAGSLRMEFERRGRGLRLIETDDWLVAASLPKQNLVSGHSYPVDFRLVNKSGQPLTVAIAGADDKNITFAYAATVQVSGEQTVSGQFTVGEITEEQNTWLTHPTVTARLLINGKQAVFKIGVVTKFPGQLRVVAPEQLYAANASGEFYLNLENGYDEPAEFRFTLPDCDFLQLGQREFCLQLAAAEKRATPVAYQLQRPGLFQGAVSVAVRPASGGAFEYKQQLIAAFAGRGSRLGGETDNGFFAINGNHMLFLGKYSNNLELRSLVKDYNSSFFTRPQLGLPYSVEFAKTKATRVEWREEGLNDVVLQATYLPKDQPGLELVREMRLGADGLFCQRWQLTNNGCQPIADIWFKSYIDLVNSWPALPLGGRVIEARDQEGFLGEYPVKDLDENWIYSATGQRGLCWPRTLNVKGNDWLWIEENLGTLQPGEQAVIPPIYLANGTFSSWQQLRQFALGSADLAPLTAAASLEVAVNDGNPFVGGDCRVAVQQHQARCFSGELVVDPAGRRACSATLGEDGASVVIPGPGPGTVELIPVSVRTPGIDYQRQAAVFGVGGTVKFTTEQQAGQALFRVANGVISFAAAPDFGPVVCSLKHKEREWLDCPFPTPVAKSWWNPWLGGIGFGLRDLSDGSLLKEPRQVRQASRRDSHGNNWQGLAIEVTVREHDRYRGLLIRHWVLTLPGLAGVCSQVEFEHQGLALTGVSCNNALWLQPGRPGAGWVRSRSPWGYELRIKQGEENSISDGHLLLAGGDGPETLLVHSPGILGGYANSEALLINTRGFVDFLPGRAATLPCQFYLFSGDLPEQALEPLAALTWAPRN